MVADKCVLNRHEPKPHFALSLRQACGALWCLTGNPENKVRGGAAGGIEAVVAAMRRQRNDTETLKLACGALQNLGVNAENELRAAGAGAIEAVVAAMRAHWADPELQRRGCAALYNLTGDDGNKTRAARAGAVEAVLQAMRTFRLLHPEVQAQACDALRSLVRGPPPGDVRSRAVSAGAAEEVVGALRAHRDSSEVQLKGLSALRALCEARDGGNGGGGGAAGDEAARRAADAGVFADVAAAMAAHPQDAALQERALAALRSLLPQQQQGQGQGQGQAAATAAAADRRVKAEAGGVSAAAAATLRAHPESTEIRRLALELFPELAAAGQQQPPL